MRPASPADAPLIVRFNRALARETEDRELDPETLEAGVAVLLAEPHRGRYFLAEPAHPGRGAGGAASGDRGKPGEGGEPRADGDAGADGDEGAGGDRGRSPRAVGQLLVTHEWSDWRNGEVWWIQSVYIAARWRRRGVYRALHEHVRREARRIGAAGIRLYVDRENRGAQATYRSLGMDESRYLMFEEMWS